MSNIQELLNKLARDGGCIVSSGDCGPLEIADAQARGDFYTDTAGLGFVLRPHAWLRKHSRFARNADAPCEARGGASP